MKLTEGKTRGNVKSMSQQSRPTKPPPAPKPKKTLTTSFLPEKDLFRVDEVADYFGVDERTIRLWIEHGHLVREKIVGVIRIPRESIIKCRFPKSEKNSEML